MSARVILALSVWISTSFNRAEPVFPTTLRLEKNSCSEVSDLEHGEWTSWSPWTACSESCGLGLRNQTRSCFKPSPVAKDCPLGQTDKSEPCYLKKCQDLSGWSKWSPWTDCVVPKCRDLPGGIRTRNKTDGDEVGQEEPCSYYPCTQHFGLLSWTDLIPYSADANVRNGSGELFTMETNLNAPSIPFVIGDELFLFFKESQNKPGKKYNFQNGKWTDLGLNPVPNAPVLIETKDGRMWFTGGVRDGLHLSETRLYDHETDTLIPKNDLPVGSQWHAAARIGSNEILFAQGLNWHRKVYVYNEDFESYSMKADAPWGSYGGALVRITIANGQARFIYAGGGDGAVSPAIYFYDLNADLWTAMPFSLPVGLVIPFWHQTAADAMIFLGGVLPGWTETSDRVFEISENGVKELERMSRPHRMYQIVKLPTAKPTL